MLKIGGRGRWLGGRSAADRCSERGVREAATGFEGVDFGGCLVRADTGDTRETEGEATLVALARLDDVEGDLEDGVGHDGAEAAVDLERVSEEVFGELGDLGVGQAGVSFTDGKETVVVFFVAD